MVKLECDRCGCEIRRANDIGELRCNADIGNGFVIFRSGLRERAVSLCDNCFKWLCNEVLKNSEAEEKNTEES